MLSFKIKNSPLFVLIILLVFIAPLSLLISLRIGSVSIHFYEWKSIFFNSAMPLHTILFDLRLPRTLSAFTTGGLLALSGVLMQVLLGNPLADPYVLGISGGAAIAVLIALLFGITAFYLNGIAFIGSLCALALILYLSGLRKRNASSLQLLLTGIIMASIWSAGITFILTVSPSHSLPGMLFWLMGDFSYAHYSWWYLFVLAVGLGLSWYLAKSLNILSRGTNIAQTLGVNTKRLQRTLLILSAILTGCAVSIAGCVSFIGLIVPHMVRLIGGSDHRFTIPASVLLGGSLLTLADTCARSILSPIQLPVGILTTLIGAPILLWLLHRKS